MRESKRDKLPNTNIKENTEEGLREVCRVYTVQRKKMDLLKNSPCIFYGCILKYLGTFWADLYA